MNIQSAAIAIKNPKQLAELIHRGYAEGHSFETNLGDDDSTGEMKQYILIRIGGEGSQIYAVDVTAALVWAAGDFLKLDGGEA